MPSSRRILVPLDGSKNGEKAVAAALQLATALDWTLRPIYVVDDAGNLPPAALDRARVLFREYVRELVDRMGGEQHHSTTSVVAGSPARRILDASRSAEMVVLASHGHGGVRAALVGSVADKVVRGAVRPTLVVPAAGPGQLDGPIVVGLDGSLVAEQGLEFARQLALALGAQPVLVRAWHVTPANALGFAFYQETATTEMEAEAKAYLAGVARPGEETFSLNGSAIEVIGEVCDKVDAGMLVLTTQGKGLGERIALGSTTDRALHSLKRPTVVVPTARDADGNWRRPR